MLKKIFYLLFLPFLILIRVCSKFFIIRLGELPSERIGHFAACMELYLCELDHKINVPKKKYLDLFILGKNISNKQIEVFLRRKFIILPRIILGPLINLNKIIPGGKIHDFYFRKNLNETKNFIKHRDIHNLLDISENHFKFSKKENYESLENCDQIGIDLKKKTAIINLRDEHYFNNYHSNKDFSYFNLKNCDIEDYQLAIRELINNNYQVIRIGKGSNKELQINNSNYFDLTNHAKRTDLLELFLIEKSKFFIGCNSGGTYAALYLFKKPTYISNFIPLGIAFTNSNKILINFKSIVCTKTNKILSLNEIFNRGLFFYEKNEKYKKENLFIKNLNPKIIKSSVIELMLRSENKWIETDEEKRLKKKFLEVYMNLLKKHDQLLHGKIKCNFGYEYLKANQELLK